MVADATAGTFNFFDQSYKAATPSPHQMEKA